MHHRRLFFSTQWTQCLQHGWDTCSVQHWIKHTIYAQYTTLNKAQFTHSIHTEQSTIYAQCTTLNKAQFTRSIWHWMRHAIYAQYTTLDRAHCTHSMQHWRRHPIYTHTKTPDETHKSHIREIRWIRYLIWWRMNRDSLRAAKPPHVLGWECDCQCSFYEWDSKEKNGEHAWGLSVSHCFWLRRFVFLSARTFQTVQESNTTEDDRLRQHPWFSGVKDTLYMITVSWTVRICFLSILLWTKMKIQNLVKCHHFSLNLLGNPLPSLRPKKLWTSRCFAHAGSSWQMRASPFVKIWIRPGLKSWLSAWIVIRKVHLICLTFLLCNIGKHTMYTQYTTLDETHNFHILYSIVWSTQFTHSMQHWIEDTMYAQ